MWNNPLEKLPKNNAEVLCSIKGCYEVGVFNTTTRKFKHTLGYTPVSQVDAWMSIPVFSKVKRAKDG